MNSCLTGTYGGMVNRKVCFVRNVGPNEIYFLLLPLFLHNEQFSRKLMSNISACKIRVIFDENDLPTAFSVFPSVQNYV
jgi:hypothetical protein